MVVEPTTWLNTVISCLSTPFEPEPLVRTKLVGAYFTHIAFSRPYDSRNRNGKHMKQEATQLTEAQRCEMIARLSKRALGQEYEVSEGVL